MNAPESTNVATRVVSLESEAHLISGVRSGYADSMATLYEKYREPGLRFIRGLMPGAQESEDVLHDAFAKSVCAIRNGYGPSDMFGPYLNTAIRSVTATFWNKRVREQPAPDEVLDAGPFEGRASDTVLSALEHENVAAAMRSLPERWRTALWYSVIMGDSPRFIAPILGIEPNAVSALLVRAKAGLRSAYALQRQMNGSTRSRRPKPG